MNNKGVDQTVRMRRLICAFVVCMWHKQVFSWRGSYHSRDWYFTRQWFKIYCKTKFKFLLLFFSEKQWWTLFYPHVLAMGVAHNVRLVHELAYWYFYSALHPLWFSLLRSRAAALFLQGEVKKILNKLLKLDIGNTGNKVVTDPWMDRHLMGLTWGNLAAT